MGKEVSEEERRLFSECFLIANKDLVINFGKESAVQIQGLPMGMSCSPDLANLYGAHFEEKILAPGTALRERMPFFGRYLDADLGIVYAATAEEALSLAKEISYDGVEIVWTVSEWHTPFLDMFIYLDPASRTLEYKPYRKPLNHRERIPWASHHPKDVKKGTFIGEMSRLATLSSKSEHYLEALVDLRRLYCGRGYPPDLVRKWLKENTSKRWEQRLNEPIPTSEVLVLKTHFNPAWSAFNIHELGNRVSISWRRSIGEMLLHRANTHPVPDNSGPPEYHEWQLMPAVAPVGDRPQFRPPPALVQLDLFQTLRRPRDQDSDDASMDPVEGTDNSTVSRSPSPAQNPPAPTQQRGARIDAGPGLVFSGRLAPVKGGRSMELERVVDMVQLGYCDRTWLVSRKRNKNLFDLTTAWKRRLLNEARDADALGGYMDEGI